MSSILHFALCILSFALRLATCDLRVLGEMMRTFMPVLKSEDEWRPLQSEGLRWTIQHAFEGSAFYRQRLEKAGVHPRDIARLEDLPKLPFTTAEDLREGYPFPLLSVPLERVVR